MKNTYRVPTTSTPPTQNLQLNPTLLLIPSTTRPTPTTTTKIPAKTIQTPTKSPNQTNQTPTEATNPPKEPHSQVPRHLTDELAQIRREKTKRRGEEEEEEADHEGRQAEEGAEEEAGDRRGEVDFVFVCLGREKEVSSDGKKVRGKRKAGRGVGVVGRSSWEP
jgi:type IV secretory pathway VirB10-like protein